MDNEERSARRSRLSEISAALPFRRFKTACDFMSQRISSGLHRFSTIKEAVFGLALSVLFAFACVTIWAAALTFLDL